jgi:hypothetical protein
MQNPEFEGLETISGLDFKTMDFNSIKKGLEKANIITSRPASIAGSIRSKKHTKQFSISSGASSYLSENSDSTKSSNSSDSDSESEESLESEAEIVSKCRHGKEGKCKKCKCKVVSSVVNSENKTWKLFIPPKHKSKGNKTYSNYLYGNDENYMKAIETKIRRYRALKSEAIQISIEIAEEDDDITIDSDISDIEAAIVRLETILSQSEMRNDVNMVCDIVGSIIEKTFDGKRTMPIVNKKMNLIGAKRVLREKFATVGPEISEYRHQVESKIGKTGSLVFQIVASMASLAIKNADIS